jgi:hypothetical protein
MALTAIDNGPLFIVQRDQQCPLVQCPLVVVVVVVVVAFVAVNDIDGTMCDGITDSRFYVVK